MFYYRRCVVDRRSVSQVTVKTTSVPLVETKRSFSGLSHRDVYRDQGKFVMSNLLRRPREIGSRFKMDYTDIRWEGRVCALWLARCGLGVKL